MMKIKELWQLIDKHRYSLEFKRFDTVSEGTYWKFVTKGEGMWEWPEVELERKDLEQLFEALKKELYPEQTGVTFRRSPEEILTTFWEYKPTHCPVCGERLRKSRYYADGDFCGQLHGKLYTVTIDNKRWYKWYMLGGLG